MKKKQILELLKEIIAKLNETPETTEEVVEAVSEPVADGTTETAPAVAPAETNSEASTVEEVAEVPVSDENQKKINVILNEILKMLENKTTEPTEKEVGRVKG